jgi:hypothetical protein
MTFYYKDGTSQLFDLSDKGDMVTGQGANKVYIFHNTFYTDKLE